jgi:Spy/CpxP family protein refolding chaperone
MRRSKALALVFLGSTLVVGAAAGFTVDRVLARRACESTADRDPFREYLARKLDLTPSQRAAVDSILDKRYRDRQSVMDPFQPQLDAARARLDSAHMRYDSTRAAVLTPVRPQLDSIRVAARGEIFKVLDDKQDSLFQQLIDESQRRDSTKKEKKKQ